jgi:hypothetical protein
MSKLIAIILLIIIGLSRCEKDEIVCYLDSYDKNKYYSEEIIPLEHQNFYGIWKLCGISGGFSGSGYDIDFDFMEIKQIGIYGLIRGDSVFEYGRIEVDTFTVYNNHLLQFKIHPEDKSHYFPFPILQFTISIHNDGLDMYNPFPDSYMYHFKRAG